MPCTCPCWYACLAWLCSHCSKFLEPTISAGKGLGSACLCIILHENTIGYRPHCTTIPSPLSLASSELWTMSATLETRTGIIILQFAGNVLLFLAPCILCWMFYLFPSFAGLLSCLSVLASLVYGYQGIQNLKNEAERAISRPEEFVSAVYPHASTRSSTDGTAVSPHHLLLRPASARLERIEDAALHCCQGSSKQPSGSRR